MSMFQIKRRFFGNILFEVELSAEVAAQPYALQLGFAIKVALKSGAVLRDADLRGADLSGADLSGADLSGADLSDFRQDLIAEVLKVPNEIDGLRLALVEGRIDGSTYSGRCACLAGTVANLREIEDYSGADIDAEGMTFVADASSPRERWFMGIRPGDTPESNPMAGLALEWIDEAIAIRDHIRSVTKVSA